MTQTLTAYAAAPSTSIQRVPAVVHGTDPVRGNAVTLHFTMIAPDIMGRTYRVERVEGEVRNPDVWMQARKETTVVTEAEAIEIARRA